MMKSSAISKVLSELRTCLDEGCNQLETDFKNNLEIFQLSNFQIGGGSFHEKPYELDLGTRHAQILDDGQKMIAQPVCIKFKIYASSEEDDSGIYLLENEFRERLDTLIIDWSLHSSRLGKPITNNDIHGNSDQKSVGVGRGTYSLTIRREFNLVVITPCS